MAVKRDVNMHKASMLAIIANSLQVILLIVIMVYVLITPEGAQERMVGTALVLVAGMAVVFGAVMDIRDALYMRRLFARLEDMDHAVANVEEMNNVLRSQRHDFLNHLQVVYSLMEMKEYKEANNYIEQVYGNITAVSRVMKTSNATVNALLQVKVAAAERAGITVDLRIQSAWKDMPIQGWEMCKVLSNLIDNAMDALREKAEGEKTLTITLTEDIRKYAFAVENNGPMIPKKMQSTIFQPGITTKATGHGMGLYIARKTMQEAGGELTLSSNENVTVFSGWLPRTVASGEKKKK